MSPEDIPENFGVFHNGKNWKFENFGWWVPTENSESRTHQGELLGPLLSIWGQKQRIKLNIHIFSTLGIRIDHKV